LGWVHALPWPGGGVIFDIGSGQCKPGLSGEQAPGSVISTVVGCPKFKLVMSGVSHKDCSTREETQSKRGILPFTYPMENGVVPSWDDTEKIWRYLYEHELETERDAKKTTEMMFKSCQVPALFVTLRVLTALYACACTTGLALGGGDDVTIMVPVYKGHYLFRGITRLDFAGRDQALLRKQVEREIVRDMKEKLCYVALDPSQNMQEKPEKLTCEYILPDGRAVKAGDQLFQAPEVLSVPAEAEIPRPWVGRMVFQSIVKCRECIQSNILRKVLLLGGSSLF
uniref:Actin-related protein T2 n=1 Tax=Otus sunia TaxID=257818 RepID=A0A8C8AWU4_9STRI